MKDDLVYFIHGNHAAVSAYVQGEADARQRNANFVTVGAFVPLSYGRLGRSWMHAADLKRLAQDIVSNGHKSEALEQYWEQHQVKEAPASLPGSSSSSRRLSTPTDLDRKRKRARSDASGHISGKDTLPEDHPAQSISDLLNVFGPLLFPIYRLTLLRKRILILGNPPVQQSCNFVYILSILSGIPQELAEFVQPDQSTPLRIHTLFSVGIHDIPMLSDSTENCSWLACTTDDILGEKKSLYDILVTLPDSTFASRETSHRPTLRTSDGVSIKATQRDLRRYRLLRAELDRIQSLSTRYRDDLDEEANPGDLLPLMRASTTNLLQEVKHSEPNESDVVEPVSWTAMAYNGFMWWASAGEMEAWENEEVRTDRQLLEDLSQLEDVLPRPGERGVADGASLKPNSEVVATIMTAYFHRLTAQMVQPLADLVEDADDDTEEGIADSAITINGDDVRAMGLDSWSAGDLDFAKNMLELYFGRDAIIDPGGTRICGVRVC